MGKVDDVPSIFPDWAYADSADIAQPGTALSQSGWQPSDRPTAQEINWLFRQIGQWIRQLAGQANGAVYATTLDGSARLVGGGLFAFNATTGALSWSQAINIVFPGVGSGSNQIAAGSATLADQQVLYTTANVPLVTTASVVSGNATVEVSFNGGITKGMQAVGSGIPSGATVQNVAGNSITLSAPATISQDDVQLTFGGSGALTVSAVSPASLHPNSNTIILAIRTGNAVHVGINAGWATVRAGESKYLHGANGYGVTQMVSAGVALNANVAVYISDGSSSQTAGAAYPCVAANGASEISSAFVGFTATGASAGGNVLLVQSGAITPSTAPTPGTTYYVDPASAGGITATKPSGQGQWIVPVGVGGPGGVLLVRPGNRRGDQVYPDINAAGITALGTVQAASFVSGSGFKQTIHLGGCNEKSATTALVQGTELAPSSATVASPTAYPYSPQVPFSGSIMSLTVHVPGQSRSAAGLMLKATSYYNVDRALYSMYAYQLVGGNNPLTVTSQGSYYVKYFTKGQLPVTAGDQLQCFFAGAFDSNGNPVSGWTMAAFAYCTVEYAG